MLLNSDGLVIREQNTGEHDRIVTILTREYGVVRAFANGARRLKSKTAAATSLFCYARFSLFAGREKYIVREAEPIEIFFAVRGEIARLSLAQYFCELCLCLAPMEDKADAFLRLMLHSLQKLGAASAPEAQIKAVFELRMLSLAGYMPDLLLCRVCGAYEADPMYFAPQHGTLYCSACRPRDGGLLPLGRGVLAAMRHIIYAEPKRIFAFTMPPAALDALGRAVEGFALTQLDRSFATLAFYKTVAAPMAQRGDGETS